jgi:hypothetical protein
MPVIQPAPLTLWGHAPAGTPEAIAWSTVIERLQETDDYWLVTAGPTGPAPRPVWGLWIEHRLLLSVGSSTHWRNLRASDRIAVHVGDAHDVVIIEGRGTKETDPATLARLIEPYNQKYDWNWQSSSDIGDILAVEPHTVFAWRAAPNEQAQTSPFPLAAGKWIVRNDA